MTRTPLLLFITFLLLFACNKTEETPPVTNNETETNEDTTIIEQDTTIQDSTIISITCTWDNLEADPIGQWYKGDFHVHATGASNDTGGDSYPIDIKAKALERGLDFVILTDHSNSTGSDASTTEEDSILFNMGPEFPYWQEAEDLSEAGTFLMVDGNEISPRSPINTEATGHIGCIPISLENFDTTSPFIDRPMGSVTGGEALQQALDRGCFSVINHPYGSFNWIKYDWSSYDYHAIEIWNGTVGFDASDEAAYNAWRCDLLSGRNVAAIGGSDNHRVNYDPPGEALNPCLACPKTAVFACEFTWEEIMQGLQNGKTAIGEGESIVYINGYNQEGCREENSNTRLLRLRGKADANLSNPQIILTQATACNDLRPDTQNAPEITETIVLEQTLTANEEFDIRVEIDGENGVYIARILHEDRHYGAISRALVIE